eukprot:CAMPEP_0179220534 /NCGR_PEP_ID=MMETSP0797-20121207/5674_1 /TAXON_ID=47934 /ORGANISM="Dinophysis acuminata, Strain DAEP01" /LENGTH=448 /DNA_ID=CAMNT_0020927187 /DNA_START=32 /DNA_END=1378 /DNA_ORIENTATION=-
MWRAAACLALASGAGASDVCTASGGCADSLASGWPVEDVVTPEDTPCREALRTIRAGKDKVGKLKEPTVVTGVPGLGKWNLELFGRAQFQSDFGHTRVKVFSPSQAALCGAQTSRLHPIRRVLSKLRNNSQLLYVFDPEFFNNESAKQAARIPKSLQMSDSSQLLTVGGPRSGTQFHSHGIAFLTLLAGRKRWYFHRPGAFPNASARHLHRNVEAFETDVLPTLGDEAPIRCMQYPGDTILVPDAWAHATINIDETIGVAWQRFSAQKNVCKMGNDYMCVTQAFVSAKHISAMMQNARFRDLFSLAETITGGFPVGFLRNLVPYWQVSPGSAKEIFKRELERVRSFLKAAPKDSDDAVLGAALTKVLVDVYYEASKDLKKASQILLPAATKVPEAGLGVSLAQLLAMQERWQEVLVQVERHLVHFPEDPTAALMLVEGRKMLDKQKKL